MGDKIIHESKKLDEISKSNQDGALVKLSKPSETSATTPSNNPSDAKESYNPTEVKSTSEVSKSKEEDQK